MPEIKCPYTPIEMSRGTHYGNNYFITYSMKMRRNVSFFSNLEYYNFLTLESNSNVEMFCEQPLKIEVLLDGERKNAIFDMWVKYKDGTEEFQEVKYSSELENTDTESKRSQEQIRRQKLWCEDNQVPFVVKTDKDILKNQYYIKNLDVIVARIRRYVPVSDEEYYQMRISRVFEDIPHLTIKQMIDNEMLPIEHEFEHLCYLFSKGFISMDLNKHPLDNKTEVSLCQKD